MAELRPRGQLVCTDGAMQRLGLALAGPGWPWSGSHCAVRWADPRLWLPLLGRRGVRVTPRFTYRVEALGRCQCRHVWANDLGRRGDGDVPLPRLPPLADVGATCSGSAAPIQALRAKLLGLVVCAHVLVLLPSIGAALS